MKKILSARGWRLWHARRHRLARRIAAGRGHNAAEPTHFPIHKPKQEDWSFAGPFGTYDKAQLQRGLKVYKEVCSACHSMNLVAFRTLEDLGYSEAQVKAFAAEYTVQDGPNDDGEMFDRPGIPSDHFPSPFPNVQAAAAANGGAAPPDFSLLAKARGVERGFPTFVFDIFTQYAGGRPGLHPRAADRLRRGAAGGHGDRRGHATTIRTSSPACRWRCRQPLSDDQVTYDDGSPQTVDQYSRDVSAFLMWAAEPHLEDRKKTGFRVMVFLLLFGGADLPDQAQDLGRRRALSMARTAIGYERAPHGALFFCGRRHRHELARQRERIRMKPSLEDIAARRRSAPSRTIRSRASCFATSPRCSAMRAPSAARSTNWCIPMPAQKIDKIAGIEARGFILGGAIAHQLSAGFVPIRKKGKLPHETVRVAYSLEYGLDEMEMHKDAVAAGREGDPGRRSDRHRRHGGRRGEAACARWAPISSPPASSSTCRISADAQKLEALGVPVRTLIAFEGH